MKRRKMLLAIVVSMFMMIGFLPGVAVADPLADPESYAFVPNSGEASVSKVILNPDAPPVEVARYNTIPEGRDNPDYGLSDYRPVRLALDSGGNAWALNTMSRQGFTQHTTAQGSVVRINADEVEDEQPGETSTSSTMVPGDVRVTYFDVGDPGDAPRTIDVVEEDGKVFLWIGFYSGGYFEKFEYDPDANDGDGSLEQVEDTKVETGFTPYYTALDANGIMWVSSRNSGWPKPGVGGVFTFDTNAPLAGIEVLPYATPVGNNNPYAIRIIGAEVWISDFGFASNDRYFAVYSGDGTEASTNVDYELVANTAGMRGFTDFEGDIWATSTDGKLFKGTFDETTWSFELVRSDLGNFTVGIGSDAFGYLWIPHHDGNQIRRFDPQNPGAELFDVDVGVGPYAYSDFVVPEPPKGEIDGYKALTENLAGILEDLEVEDPLAGWEIKLYAWDTESLGPILPRLATVYTDEDGYFLFEDLDPGWYLVKENPKPGTFQVEPDPPDHIVEVIAGETTTVEVDGEDYAFLNDAVVVCETAWAYGEGQYGEDDDRKDVAKANNTVEGNPSNAWGWTNWITEAETTLILYTGAGQNDLEKGTEVGTVTVEFVGDEVVITYALDSELCWFSEIHLHIGDTELPLIPVGRFQTPTPTAAPGQFEFDMEDFVYCEVDKTFTLTLAMDAPFWLSAHAVVCCFELNGNGNNDK